MKLGNWGGERGRKGNFTRYFYAAVRRKRMRGNYVIQGNHDEATVVVMEFGNSRIRRRNFSVRVGVLLENRLRPVREIIAWLRKFLAFDENEMYF